MIAPHLSPDRLDTPSGRQTRERTNSSSFLGFTFGSQGISQMRYESLTTFTIENVVKYIWSIQSVNTAVQNVGPVG